MLEEKVSLCILVVFGVITFFELLYYYGIFARFSFSKKKESVTRKKVPVSVIMVAKDAANSLLKSLPKLLAQQYPNFEIVIVNDHSADETAQLLLDYQQRYPNIKAVNLYSSISTIRGKKFALSLGIRCASHENMLFTEPECCPNSTHWLTKMARHFDQRHTLVLGYCTFEKRPTLQNKLLHFDHMVNALQYFSYSLIHTTFRGDGRNIAYNKMLFNAQKGFASHNHLRFGEDDLFVAHAATKKNCVIEYSPESVVTIKHFVPHLHWRDRKEGYYFMRKYYSLKNRFLLNNFDFINLLFYVAFVVSLILSVHHVLLLSCTLGILGVKILSQYFVFGFAAHKLNEKQVLTGLLFYDFIFAMANPLYYLFAKIHSHRFI